jgi:hypothetical protein
MLSRTAKENFTSVYPMMSIEELIGTIAVIPDGLAKGTLDIKVAKCRDESLG